MRYQVPQFVDVEDTVIGPLTIKQFLMYVVAVLVLIPVYLFSDLSLFITVALPVLGVAAAFAHWKVNGQSLAATIAHGFQFITAGQLYIWRRTSKPHILVLQDRNWEDLIRAREEAQDRSVGLENIARGLETDGKISDIDEVDPLTLQA